jgi:hypothetical protein
MAYNPKNLSVLAYANGFMLRHYTTTDSVAAVAGNGYFNAAADMLRIGDMIITNAATESGNLGGTIFFVHKVHSGEVVVTPFGEVA